MGLVGVAFATFTGRGGGATVWTDSLLPLNAQIPPQPSAITMPPTIPTFFHDSRSIAFSFNARSILPADAGFLAAVLRN
jgi:hypothetical protein